MNRPLLKVCVGGGELRRAEGGSWGESHHWFEGQYYLLLMPSGCENVALVMGLKPSNPDSVGKF